MRIFPRSIALAVVTAASITGAANAATLSVDGSVPALPPAGNDFVPGGLSGLTFIDALTALVVNGRSILTFTEVGAQSSFDSTFTASGTSITENADFGIPNFSDGASFSKTYAGGTSLFGLLGFTSNLGNAANPGDYGFGVYAAGGPGAYSTLYFAYDDAPWIDSDYSDYLIRVDVAPVPLPATGLMLLMGIGGLAALQRRVKC